MNNIKLGTYCFMEKAPEKSGFKVMSSSSLTTPTENVSMGIKVPVSKLKGVLVNTETNEKRQTS